MNTATPGGAYRFPLGEEIANSISHGFGAIVALVAGPFLISTAVEHGSAGAVVGTAIFVLTAFILYLTSALYHALAWNRAKSIFQILDHSAIFLLIAGTYTPFALGILPPPTGWYLLTATWGLACLGVTLKTLRKFKYAWLSTALYLCMGWSCLGVAPTLLRSVATTSLVWLGIGGASYTLGVIFFVLDEKVRYSHFIWHLFVLVGTIAHFFSVYFAFAPAIA